MRSAFDAGWYIPKRDGPLEEYLRSHNGYSGTFSLFKGYRYYGIMKKRGYLIPNCTIIRLMWNVVRGDEHFGVTEDFQLMGIGQDTPHPGRPGIHDPRKILSSRNPCWEVHNFKLPSRFD